MFVHSLPFLPPTPTYFSALVASERQEPDEATEVMRTFHEVCAVATSITLDAEAAPPFDREWCAPLRSLMTLTAKMETCKDDKWFALNETCQGLGGLPTASYRGPAWENRNAVQKKLLSAAMGALASASLPNAASQAAMVRVTAAKSDGSGGSFISVEPTQAVMIHQWADGKAARRLVSRLQRWWNLLFETRTLGAAHLGSLTVPCAILVTQAGQVFTVMPLAPMTSKANDHPFTTAALMTLRSAMNFGDHGAIDAAYIGADTRTYIMCGAPTAGLQVELPRGDVVPLRSEAVSLLCSSAADVLIGSDVRKIEDMTPADWAIAVREVLIPQCLNSMLRELVLKLSAPVSKDSTTPLHQDNAAVAKFMMEMTTTSALVSRSMHVMGVNMGFLGCMLAHANDRLSKRRDDEVEASALSIIREAIVSEIACRTLKHTLRCESANTIVSGAIVSEIADRSAASAVTSRSGPLTLLPPAETYLERVHRCLALAANNEPTFWGDFSAAAQTLYPAGSDLSDVPAYFTFSLTLVKVMVWSLTPRMGLQMDAAGRIKPAMGPTPLGGAMLTMPYLARLVGSGSTEQAALLLSRDWESSVGSKTPAPIYKPSGEPEPTLPPAPLEDVSSTFLQRHSMPPAAKLLLLLRSAYLATLVRWTTHQDRHATIARGLTKSVVESLNDDLPSSGTASLLSGVLLDYLMVCGAAQSGPPVTSIAVDVLADSAGSPSSWCRVLPTAPQGKPSTGIHEWAEFHLDHCLAGAKDAPMLPVLRGVINACDASRGIGATAGVKVLTFAFNTAHECLLSVAVLPSAAEWWYGGPTRLIEFCCTAGQGGCPPADLYPSVARATAMMEGAGAAARGTFLLALIKFLSVVVIPSRDADGRLDFLQATYLPVAFRCAGPMVAAHQRDSLTRSEVTEQLPKQLRCPEDFSCDDSTEPAAEFTASDWATATTALAVAVAATMQVPGVLTEAEQRGLGGEATTFGTTMLQRAVSGDLFLGTLGDGDFISAYDALISALLARAVRSGKQQAAGKPTAAKRAPISKDVMTARTMRLQVGLLAAQLSRAAQRHAYHAADSPRQFSPVSGTLGSGTFADLVQAKAMAIQRWWQLRLFCRSGAGRVARWSLAAVLPPSSAWAAPSRALLLREQGGSARGYTAHLYKWAASRLESFSCDVWKELTMPIARRLCWRHAVSNFVEGAEDIDRKSVIAQEIQGRTEAESQLHAGLGTFRREILVGSEEPNQRRQIISDSFSEQFSWFGDFLSTAAHLHATSEHSKLRGTECEAAEAIARTELMQEALLGGAALGFERDYIGASTQHGAWWLAVQRDAIVAVEEPCRRAELQLSLADQELAFVAEVLFPALLERARIDIEGHNAHLVSQSSIFQLASAEGDARAAVAREEIDDMSAIMLEHATTLWTQQLIELSSCHIDVTAQLEEAWRSSEECEEDQHFFINIVTAFVEAHGRADLSTLEAMEANSRVSEVEEIFRDWVLLFQECETRTRQAGAEADERFAASRLVVAWEGLQRNALLLASHDPTVLAFSDGVVTHVHPTVVAMQEAAARRAILSSFAEDSLGMLAASLRTDVSCSACPLEEEIHRLRVLEAALDFYRVQKPALDGHLQHELVSAAVNGQGRHAIISAELTERRQILEQYALDFMTTHDADERRAAVILAHRLEARIRQGLMEAAPRVLLNLYKGLIVECRKALMAEEHAAYGKLRDENNLWNEMWIRRIRLERAASDRWSELEVLGQLGAGEAAAAEAEREQARPSPTRRLPTIAKRPTKMPPPGEVAFPTDADRAMIAPWKRKLQASLAPPSHRASVHRPEFLAKIKAAREPVWVGSEPKTMEKLTHQHQVAVASTVASLPTQGLSRSPSRFELPPLEASLMLSSSLAPSSSMLMRSQSSPVKRADQLRDLPALVRASVNSKRFISSLHLQFNPLTAAEVNDAFLETAATMVVDEQDQRGAIEARETSVRDSIQKMFEAETVRGSDRIPDAFDVAFTRLAPSVFQPMAAAEQRRRVALEQERERDVIIMQISLQEALAATRIGACAGNIVTTRFSTKAARLRASTQALNAKKM